MVLSSLSFEHHDRLDVRSVWKQIERIDPRDPGGHRHRPGDGRELLVRLDADRERARALGFLGDREADERASLFDRGDTPAGQRLDEQSSIAKAEAIFAEIGVALDARPAQLPGTIARRAI